MPKQIYWCIVARVDAFRTKEMKLLDALLALLEAQKPGVALATLMLGADKGANDRIVRDLGKARLVSFDLMGETVEFGPIDLCIPLARIPV
jgi:hypothetical protein